MFIYIAGAPMYSCAKLLCFEAPSIVHVPQPHLTQPLELFTRLSFLLVSTVPIDATAGIKMLYVFVDIQMDNAHFLDTVKFNFPPGQSLALVSTIQFVAALQVMMEHWHGITCSFCCGRIWNASCLLCLHWQVDWLHAGDGHVTTVSVLHRIVRCRSRVHFCSK